MVNVALDTLDADAYRRITRGGNLAQVLDGIDAARAAGLKLKINVVALQENAAELPDLIALAHGMVRSEEHTSELQSLMRISYAVFCLKKKTKTYRITHTPLTNTKVPPS